jgi:hypothetical protein
MQAPSDEVGNSQRMNRMNRFKMSGGQEMIEKPQQKKVIDLKKELGKESGGEIQKKKIKCRHWPNC